MIRQGNHGRNRGASLLIIQRIWPLVVIGLTSPPRDILLLRFRRLFPGFPDANLARERDWYLRDGGSHRSAHSGRDIIWNRSPRARLEPHRESERQ